MYKIPQSLFMNKSSCNDSLHLAKLVLERNPGVGKQKLCPKLAAVLDKTLASYFFYLKFKKRAFCMLPCVLDTSWVFKLMLICFVYKSQGVSLPWLLWFLSTPQLLFSWGIQQETNPLTILILHDIANPVESMG